VEVHENKLVMLAETAERSGEIDVTRAEAARERARKRLADKEAGIDIERARLALHRALNRLKVAARQ
jgi:F-type H+-transporting ATPase subunit epsilon